MIHCWTFVLLFYLHTFNDQDNQVKEAPDDYWGDWSSENASQDGSEESDASSASGSEDSEDVYYNNWSNHPDTNEGSAEDDMETDHVSHHQSREMRSPSFFRQLDAHYDAGKPTSVEQDEIEEEYDNSHNPLFTVPSVPNLMDMHTSALQELTTILNTTIQPNGSGKSGAINMNPLPKVLYQRQITDDVDYNDEDESTSRTSSVMNSVIRLPGGWPESRQEEDDMGYQDALVSEQPTQSEHAESSGASKAFASWFSQNEPSTEANVVDARETAKGFLMKSLSALVRVARMLGFTGQQISEMVEQIVVQQQQDGSQSQEQANVKKQETEQVNQ